MVNVYIFETESSSHINIQIDFNVLKNSQTMSLQLELC